MSWTTERRKVWGQFQYLLNCFTQRSRAKKERYERKQWFGYLCGCVLAPCSDSFSWMLLKIVTVIHKVPLTLNVQLIRACGVVTGKKKIEIKGSLQGIKPLVSNRFHSDTRTDCACRVWTLWAQIMFAVLWQHLLPKKSWVGLFC